MQKLKFKRIGILIGATLLISIGVQAWRLHSQFKIIQNKLVSDIQESLDISIESYYADLAKTNVITLTDNLQLEQPAGMPLLVDTLPEGFDPKKFFTADTVLFNEISKPFIERVGKSKMIFRAIEGAEMGRPDSIFWSEVRTDSLKTFTFIDSAKGTGVDQINELNVFWGQKAADSLTQIKYLTNRIIISITRDSVEVDKIRENLKSELERRRIEINYRLIHIDRKVKLDSSTVLSDKRMPFQVVSRSTFLPRDQSLELNFENTAITILKRGIVEILTSLFFLGIIAYAFYYLYQTIKNQKEIAEIKQDLIANITHEFKTPIATTLSAIEGIQQFNPENDSSKTDRYLGISKNQMFKLNKMVEKLLETATLDSDQLVLKKEYIEPETLLRQLIQKFQTLAPEKKIELILPANPKTIFADSFHFENAISNLLDNAIKYGGDQIRIGLDQNGMHKIRIHDNGGNISPEQKERVFEQFYRIPKGNIHDVKGFGIGLYYVKKILEKHEGKIELETGKNSTTFITYWP
ncbi:two-component system, OmpR family, phosphate regulon sensor histidine kinase PhoR [Algoriphagus alkaliphilus]|uniref:histidine kinase n=1 Tax=Algoriphagus alkaliphilus TaxID=279824 RepID=A0A1G5X046_9BACT|nr:HAMP domain-containing sensor histidine kinase [Algoriphagus alkaliphilus]MBA4299819.1 sensor histidine kinase [Cyclobacterium sp.]SDA63590.1 two-component system, OmpR family, phosphate regulon sensor histidine kinase PhoR [Algoriphagus alkaliphilus]